MPANLFYSLDLAISIGVHPAKKASKKAKIARLCQIDRR